MSVEWVEKAKVAIEGLPDREGSVKVAYHCHTCKAFEAVYVEKRKDGEPLDYYMKKVTRAVQVKHTLASLDCKGRTVDLVFRFPAPEARVGGQ